ncbi:cystathionine beta-l [Meira miltonrushii]|uniref:Cystathionine beta-lyase n=1 Tax=Meira miltonrushii TaxID=1280837 RepID=A0A316VE12_9BASI|nr:cystathionine beta-l [Meira miltonrushii]PWN35812.1 cystathionine beta-l [Meira miltonrushii]
MSMYSSEGGTVTPGFSVSTSQEPSESSAPTSPGPSSLHDAEGVSKNLRPQDRRSGPSGYRFSTTCATVDDPNHKDQYGASSAPIYMSSTFKGLPGAEFDYSRSGNPTRSMLQHHLCQLQNCRYSFAVSSGMACLDVITRNLKPGERIVAGDDLYGGTNRLLVYLATHGGIATDHVDTTDASKVEEILQKRAEDHALGQSGPVKMVLLETPTNPLLKICDLERCARAAKKYAPDAWVVVDNTMMSPYLMRPLELGVDVVYDSGTKYLSGHHDLMAGVVACDRDDIGKQIAFTINSIGNALTPMDSFLLLRGIKTLAVRMDRQQTNAMQVASYLSALGFKVNFPGLASHPGKEIHDAQASGPGSVLSFETGDKELSERIVGATRLWGISVSFGCVNSLISMPCLMSHASIDPKVRAARRLPEDLIRLCVGIEDCRDLLEDLEAALLQAGAIRRRSVRSATALGELGRVANNSAVSPAGAGTVFERVFGDQTTVDQDIVKLTEGVDINKVETRGGDNEQPKDSGHSPTTLIVSAPGKVILFGEHAVVHGVRAVAASVALRCYALVESRKDDILSLNLPDLTVKHEWRLSELPWSSVPSNVDVLSPGAELNEKLHKAIEAVVGLVAGESERSHAASVAFLYLFMLISSSAPPKLGQSFTLRSALPIGAGLGSSASLSGCLASALLVTHGHIGLPKDTKLPLNDTTLINKYSFLSEKVIHGNPSGVDNAVAVHGGAIAFERPSARTGRTEALLERLNGFKSFRFLLTNTQVGRDTKSLVAGVGQRLKDDPQGMGARLDAIQVISHKASALLGQSNVTQDRSAELQVMANLIDENHQHLVDMGVSHASLELIRKTTAAAPFNLSTKLTGAGGGGCAVTLVPDSMSEAVLQQLKTALEQQGFACYETTVGGPGVGILASHSRALDQDKLEAARAQFHAQAELTDEDRSRFAQWIDGQGDWIHS